MYRGISSGKGVSSSSDSSSLISFVIGLVVSTCRLVNDDDRDDSLGWFRTVLTVTSAVLLLVMDTFVNNLLPLPFQLESIHSIWYVSALPVVLVCSDIIGCSLQHSTSFVIDFISCVWVCVCVCFLAIRLYYCYIYTRCSMCIYKASDMGKVGKTPSF